MSRSLRPALFSVLALVVCCPPVIGQQQQQAPPHVPPGFRLNQLELSYLDQVLNTWKQRSDQIGIFKCPFERWEYNASFGPGPNIPLNKDNGELSYQKPDKGSFKITKVNTWQADPAPPGEASPAQIKGTWVEQPKAIGEHWVCDGKAVYEYREDQKQLVERPIPPEMQGKAIVDGPLPFLFGADPEKLKDRYWMRIQQQPNAEEIWLQSMPKYQADAANYSQVDVVLDRAQLLPKAMQVHLPNGDRHVYIFDLAGASVNGHLDRLRSLFQRPVTPLGWKRVVEEGPGQEPPKPPQQAGLPGMLRR